MFDIYPNTSIIRLNGQKLSIFLSCLISSKYVRSYESVKYFDFFLEIFKAILYFKHVKATNRKA